MNRCDKCKHKDSCTCIPYGCECFEFDLEEHNKQIRAKVIDECVEIIRESYPIIDNEDILYGFSCAIQRIEQLKEQNK